MRVFLPARALTLAGLLAIGCGGVTSPSQNKVETFNGTLEVRGQWTQPVNIQNTGEYSVKITALSPTATAVVGAIWALGANCEFPQQQSLAQLNTPALAGAIFQRGTYCVAIYDIGTLTVAQNFTVTVSHP